MLDRIGEFEGGSQFKCNLVGCEHIDDPGMVNFRRVRAVLAVSLLCAGQSSGAEAIRDDANFLAGHEAE